jgi:aspartyl/asparaginyl-tRNA synthetase
LAEVTLSTSFMFVLVNIVTEKVREDDYTTLLERAKEMGIEEEQLSW